MHFSNHPLPKSNRLGVRIVDAKNRDASLGPKKEDPLQLLPELFPGWVVKIEGIDILVFFWRVLCILDGTIWPVEKPFRMFFDVRMVRRAVERKVECQVHVALAKLFHEPSKIF